MCPGPLVQAPHEVGARHGAGPPIPPMTDAKT